MLSTVRRRRNQEIIFQYSIPNSLPKSGAGPRICCMSCAAAARLGFSDFAITPLSPPSLKFAHRYYAWLPASRACATSCSQHPLNLLAVTSRMMSWMLPRGARCSSSVTRSAIAAIALPTAAAFHSAWRITGAIAIDCIRIATQFLDRLDAPRLQIDITLRSNRFEIRKAAHIVALRNPFWIPRANALYCVLQRGPDDDSGIQFEVWPTPADLRQELAVYFLSKANDPGQQAEREKIQACLLEIGIGLARTFSPSGEALRKIWKFLRY